MAGSLIGRGSCAFSPAAFLGTAPSPKRARSMTSSGVRFVGDEFLETLFGLLQVGTPRVTIGEHQTDAAG